MTLLCFKANYIRGRVPDELNPPQAKRMGARTATLLGYGPGVVF